MPTPTNHPDRDAEIRQTVSDRYAAVAAAKVSNATADVDAAKTVLTNASATTDAELAMAVGYSQGQLADVPEDAVLGLGCGNPTAIAALKPGDVVLDLGCGGGLDVFLASKQVGPTGKVIGVDMTPKMIDLANRNAARAGYTNVSFVLSPIESMHTHIAPSSIDVILSNCVLNLVPSKPAAFAAMYKVLKPGGRVAVSDIALKKALPEAVMKNVDAYVGCIGGAVMAEEYERWLKEAGFVDVKMVDMGKDLGIWGIDLDVEEERKGEAKAEQKAAGGCCGSVAPAPAHEPAKESSCCGTSASAAPAADGLSARVNDFAASYNITAYRPL